MNNDNIKSVWVDMEKRVRFAPLEENKKTDVLIMI